MFKNFDSRPSTDWKKVDCRCCGRMVIWFADHYPIHTRCIPKHWGKHSRGMNASRCHEFSKSGNK